MTFFFKCAKKNGRKKRFIIGGFLLHKFMNIINIDNYHSRNKAFLFILALCLVFCFEIFFFFVPFLVEQAMAKENTIKNTINIEIINSENTTKNSISTPENIIINHLPQNQDNIISTSTHLITAYNSEVAQCDDSPCITANGFNVCQHGIEDTIAANFLEFGTKVRIPELFGDKIFIVRDRMNKRHADRVDIWMINRQDALNFGAQIAKIEVLE